MTGREFLEKVCHLPRLPDREAAIYEAAAAGHALELETRRLIVRERAIDVRVDYFAIGTIDDFFRVPCSLPLARRLAELFGARLPTVDEVDAIWREADVKLEPRPWNPMLTSSARAFAARKDGADLDPCGFWIAGTSRAQLAHGETIQCSAELAAEHHAIIEAQRAGRAGLIAGHKKDVVENAVLLTHPDRVAIYGWHSLDGRPLQPLYPAPGGDPTHGHEASYSDYSHGVRFAVDV